MDVGDGERYVIFCASVPGIILIQFNVALASKPTLPLRRLAEIRPTRQTDIEGLIKALSPLRMLEELSIIGVSELAMGYDPPVCGNAYMGRSGFELSKNLDRKRREIEALLLGMVERSFGVALKKVVIGGKDTCFERREIDGKEEGKWRVGQWVRDARDEDDDSREYVEWDPYTGDFLWPERDSNSEDDEEGRDREEEAKWLRNGLMVF